MRPSIDRLLTHRCTIQRATSANTDGVSTLSWSDVATGVKCLVMGQGGNLSKSEAGLTNTAEAKVYLPAGTDIRPKVDDDRPDRIVVTSPARLAGVTYNVESVHDAAGQGHHLTAAVTRRPSLAPGN